VVVASARDSLRRVADLVVAPLGLGAPEEVVVVPVGVLQRAPWSALLSCPVSVAPSAATWQESALRPSHPGRPAVLVAGPRLEAAVDEVRALAEVHPGARVLLPPDSTSATVRAALDGAGIAHLACHGAVRADNPLFSSLELVDGMLTVHELDRRAGAPQQLVLAACDVGAGVVYPGNELLGFVGTLLARGTRGLVASTTLVADRHVLPLVRELHVGLVGGATAAVALHAARKVLDPDDPREHAAWASFTAYGAG
jgi:CHAT domain-containing protein